MYMLREREKTGIVKWLGKYRTTIKHKPITQPYRLQVATDGQSHSHSPTFFWVSWDGGMYEMILFDVNTNVAENIWEGSKTVL